METNLIDANTEIEKLKETKEEFEAERKLKNEQNELLVAEKNLLEENLARANGIVHKMFTERNNMKDIIEKQKTTIELIKESDSNDNELKAKLKEKIKELDQANKDKKRLAKDLANAQSKDKDESGDNRDKIPNSPTNRLSIA